MASVEFHILEQATGLKSLHYACQIIEKMYQQNSFLHVLVNSEEEAERLDKLLWTFKDESFLPHDLYHPDDSITPIQISAFKQPPLGDRTLINLSNTMPTAYHQVIEIVFSDPTVQQLARERFKQYRDQGCTMNTYKIKASEL